MSKVTFVDDEGIHFDEGTKLYCAYNCSQNHYHYLDFSNLTLEDFSGLEFDLSSKNFLEKVKGYGIALNPLVGFPIRIPGYASIDSGQYSDELEVVLEGESFHKVVDITECRIWDERCS